MIENNSKKNIALYPECAICFEALDQNLEAITSCGHIFHIDCLDSWIKNNQYKCPLCRKKADNTIKLIYDIKFTLPINNDDDKENEQKNTIKTVNEIIDENNYLKNQNRIIINAKNDLFEHNKLFGEKLEKFEIKFNENVKKLIKYRSENLKIKSMLDESLKKNDEYKLEIKNLKSSLEELESKKRFFDLNLNLNNKLDIILNEKDEIKRDEIFEKNFEDMYSKNDMGRTLKQYIFVLEQKIKSYYEETNKLNKKISELKKENDKGIYNILTGYPPHKRNYIEFKESLNKQNNNKVIINNNNNKEKEFEKNLKNINNSNAEKKNNIKKDFIHHPFVNPLNRKIGPSFLNK
jgi:hypothetical protein